MNDYSELTKRSNEIYDAAQGKASRGSRVLLDDANKQYYRFVEIHKFIETNDASILDVGCGNGELLNFLNMSGYTGKYTGIDVHPNLLAEARETYPNGRFLELNILDEAPATADYVVMSGLFNANFGQDWRFVERFICRMFQCSARATIFNAISTHVNSRHEAMFYVDPSDVIRFVLKELTTKVRMSHGFVPFNYTICLYKGPEWKSIQEQT